MVCQWEPWVQYDCNSVVEFEGHRYKIVQPHKSQPDWTPSIVPALWSRVPQESHNECQSGGQQHHQNQGFVDQSGGNNYGQQNNPQGGGGYGQQQQQQQQQHQQSGYDNQQSEHKEESWLDDSKKHKLQIGGGILGALAIGGGVYAYSKHKNSAVEDSKKQAWINESSREKWLEGAHAHTQHYQSGGQSPPVYWTLVNKSDPIPNNAIEGGREGGHSLYIGRTYYKGGLHIGKVSHHLGGCVIGYAGKEHNDFDKYEVLCGDKNAVKWVNHASNHGVIQAQGWQPVEGGREEDGRFLFVSQVLHEGGVHPCKAQDGTDFAIFSYGGKKLFLHLVGKTEKSFLSVAV
ncbi:hypothetical protein Pst134EA_005123 [Puccinia striiformis f. sp. tritici]|uniref:hypothetical protein n=1 Tax=Puccinia striiformis f. sp. tritici TaxID=168172 RepID=UPI002008E925|nr:hypothetical protein Pst134EA_005123 [Puccinia striiformis f. sp. tritici]KAH9471214.1 hypothetical protein Pst134EA_005123 [Puccinia striiformis f. sp. tritici]